MIEELKQQLTSFCKENQISKFDVEDIIELLQEGESVEWLIEQLKSDAPDLDVATTTELLAEIRLIVGPEEKPVELTLEEASEETLEEAAASAEAEAATEADSELPDMSNIDFSQIDMSQLRGMLPKGIQLPPGMGMKQLQQIMDSPNAKIMADLVAFCQEQGVDMTSMNDPEQMQELEEQWKKTPRAAFDGKTPAELLDADPTLIPSKVETYHREEPRIGRNEPCPCGSGKKYKKCCGRGK
jgi:preprotein translocase subunit SecA